MKITLSLTRKDPYHTLLEESVASLQQKLKLNDRKTYHVNLILDEICTNIFENNCDANDLLIAIELLWHNETLTMVFKDNGIPFNPTSVSTPDTTLPLDQRKEGGLGLFFVKKCSTSLSYERVDGINQTTVIQKIK